MTIAFTSPAAFIFEFLEIISETNDFSISDNRTNGTRIQFNDVRVLNMSTNEDADILFFHGGTEYFGGDGGFDRFAADWSYETADLVWDVGDPSTTRLANGVTVGGIDRVTVRLGSGDDLMQVISGPGQTLDEANFVDGGAGDDTLISLFSSDDILIGGEGDDLLIVRSGQSSILDGGSGSDVFLVGSTDRFVSADVIAGDGDDTVFFQGIGPDDSNSRKERASTSREDGSLLTVASTSSAEAIFEFLEIIGLTNNFNITGQGGGNNITLNGVEALNMSTGADDDLLFYHGGTEYFGGEGDVDRFAADWSDETVDFEWNVDDRSATRLANGVTVGDIDRVTLRLGSGDDLIQTTGVGNFVDAGDGDDTLISLSGGDTLIGGEGDDLIVLRNGNSRSQLEGGSGADVFLVGAEDRFVNVKITADSDDTVFFQGIGPDDSNSRKERASTSREDGSLLTVASTSSAEAIFEFLEIIGLTKNFNITGQGGGNNITLNGVEALNMSTGADDDLLFYHGGTEYFGGEGDVDRFAADWSDETVDFEWNVDDRSATRLANGVTVGDIDRVTLRLGSGDDLIQTTGVGNFVDAGAGDDTLISLSGGDTLIGGEGDDVLVVRSSLVP